jgi:hypothetical protein
LTDALQSSEIYKSHCLLFEDKVEYKAAEPTNHLTVLRGKSAAEVNNFFILC